jgi:hypothetical protein
MSPVIRVSKEDKDRLESIRRELALANRTTSTSSLGLAFKNVLDTVEFSNEPHGITVSATVSADKGNKPVQIKAAGKPEARTQKMKELIDDFFEEGVRRDVYLDVSPSKHGHNQYVSYPDRFLSIEVQEARNNSLRVSVYGQLDQVLSEAHLEASQLPFDLKPDRRTYTAFSVKSKGDVVAAWPIIQAGLKLRIEKHQGRESVIRTDMTQPLPLNSLPSLSSLVVPTGWGRTKVIGQILKNFNPEKALIVARYRAILANYRQILHSSFGYPFQEYIPPAHNSEIVLNGPILHPFLTSRVEDFSFGPLRTMSNYADEADQEDSPPDRSHFDVVVVDLQEPLDSIPKYVFHPMFSRHLILVGASQSAFEMAIATLGSAGWKDVAELEAWRHLFMG